MEELLIDTREIGNHRVKVYYDTNAECPCTNWDMSALYLWGCCGYPTSHRLSYYCNRDEVGVSERASLNDALRQLVCDYVPWKSLLKYFKEGKVDEYRMEYDKSSHMWNLKYRAKWQAKHGWYTWKWFESSEINDGDCTSEFIEDLEKDDLITILQELGKDIFVKEWSTTGYGQGDYVSGVAFCTKERYAEMVDKDTPGWKQKIDKLIDMEVKEIGMWMWGDVKCFILEKRVPFTNVYDDGRENVRDEEWEYVDSCHGFFMEADELIDEVIAEHDLVA